MSEYWANQPFKRRFIRQREEARKELRDPLSETGIEIRPQGPGLLYDEERLNIPDFKDVPAPQVNQNEYTHLPPVTEPASHQPERRDNVGNQRTNQSSGSRIFPVLWPSQTQANQPTQLLLGRTAHHVECQNNSGATIYLDFDTEASQGSIAIASGGYYSADKPMLNSLSIYATAQVNINGNTSTGIYLGVYD